MTEPAGQSATIDIETAVRAVPGVATIFRTGEIISQVVGASAQVFGFPQDEAPLIRWEHAPDGPRIDAAIGVYASTGAIGTIRRVHAAIAALCADRGCTPAEIRLTIVHIENDILIR